MKLIPYEEILYRTNLSVAEVMDRLNSLYDHKDEPKDYDASLKTSFTGEVEGLKFTLTKKEGINPFRPTVEGIVEREEDKTAIDATYRLPDLMMVLFLIWTAILFILFIRLLLAASKAGDHYGDSLVPLGVFAVSYLLLIFIFYLESKTPKKILDKILEPISKE